MQVILPILIAILAAAVSTGVVLAAARRGWASGIAVAVGYVAAHFVVAARPLWPPLETTQWLPVIAGVAGIIGVIEGAWAVPFYARWPVRLAALGAAGWLAVRPVYSQKWLAGEGAMLIGSLLGAAIVMTAALEALERRLAGAGFAAVVWLLAAGSAGVMQVFSFFLAEAAGGLAAMAGAGVVAPLVIPSAKLGRGAVFPAVAILASLLANHQIYSSETPPIACIGLIAAAPVLALASTFLTAKRGRLTAALVALVAAAPAVGAAVFLALRAAPAGDF